MKNFWKNLDWRRKILVIIGFLMFLAILMPKREKKQEETNEQKTEAKHNRISVSRSDLGENYPLTVNNCEVFCENDMLFCYANGKIYALNGLAQQKAQPIDEIWDKHPTIPNVKKSIEPLADIAKKTCK
ncbi:DUF2511 domain-containing protein [Raineya sp.]